MLESFIGVDLGTTYLKGAVLDLEHFGLSHIKRTPFPDFIPHLPVGHKEVDPNAIVFAVRDLISRLLPHAGNCQGLVMCSQMHGLVLCDESGNAQSNILTWQDQRTLEQHPSGIGDYYQALSACISDEERITLGSDLWASRPLSFLFWLAEHGRIPQHQIVVPASLPDFVIAKLCKCTPATGRANAAAYGAMNLVSGDWHHAIINRLHLDSLRWPKIKPHQSEVGIMQIGDTRLPCYTPVGDHQCALLGTLLQQDELSINVSTGSQVGLLSDHLELSLNYQTRPYLDNRYLQAVIHIPAGRSLNALIKLLTEFSEAQNVQVPDPWAYINAVTHQHVRSDLKVNLAFFPSSCGDTGSIGNLREDQMNVADLFTAAFENMADNYLDCVNRITGSQPHKRLVFSGGLVQKLGALQNIILNRFHLPYRYPPGTEDTLMGLLIMALVNSGKVTDYMAATNLMAKRFEDAIAEHTEDK